VFIRYNEALDFWEYDTSAGQDGSGPWSVLPIDYAKINNLPIIPPPYTLPANVALKDVTNIFTQSQKIEKAVTPSLQFSDITQPTDLAKFNITNFSQELFLQAVNGAENIQTGALTITRTGDGSFTGTIRERQRTVALGEWINVPYNAGNYTGLGGTWTVSAGAILENRYTLIGKTGIYVFILNASTTDGNVGQLAIKNPMPGATGYAITMARMGTADVITAYANNGDNNIYMIRPGFVNFPTSTGSLWFSIVMNVG